MNKFLKFIDNFSEWTGRIFSWIIIIMTFLVVLEVIMRKFFNSPTIWSFEVTKQLYAFYFMIVAAYTLLYNAHVSVDVIYEKLSPKKQSILDVISYIIFFFPFWIIIFIEGTKFAAKSWAIRETFVSVFAGPIYPIKTVIPVTALLILLQGIAIFIRKLHMAIKRETYG